MSELALRAFMTLFVVIDPVGMALAAPHQRETEEEEEEARSREDVSVFPLAIPLIAGPGAMASLLILIGQAGAELHKLGVVFAMTALVLGVLLAALAVQYAPTVSAGSSVRASRVQVVDALMR